MSTPPCSAEPPARSSRVAGRGLRMRSNSWYRPMRAVPWIVGLLVMPGSLAAQRAAAHRAIRTGVAKTVVTPNEHTQMLTFEHGLRVVGSSIDANGCKVMTLEAVAAPTYAHFATGVAGTLVHYMIRAGYAAGQPAPSQQTLMAAANCAPGQVQVMSHGRSGGTMTVWPPGGYPRAGQMWRNCTNTPCAVYPPPTAWGPSGTFVPAGAAEPFEIRAPSVPGLGRVIFRVYAYAEAHSNESWEIMPIDSTNAVTVAY